jgi:hypothetical protein
MLHRRRITVGAVVVAGYRELLVNGVLLDGGGRGQTPTCGSTAGSSPCQQAIRSEAGHLLMRLVDANMHSWMVAPLSVSD